MPQRKGQTGNPHGRPLGAKNKRGSELKEWIKHLIDGNREAFEADLKTVEPQQRLAMLEKLMQYVIPKMQSIDATVQIAEEYNHLERLLHTAPDEAIQRITDKIIELSNHKKQQNEKR